MIDFEKYIRILIDLVERYCSVQEKEEVSRSLFIDLEKEDSKELLEQHLEKVKLKKLEQKIREDLEKQINEIAHDLFVVVNELSLETLTIKEKDYLIILSKHVPNLQVRKGENLLFKIRVIE